MILPRTTRSVVGERCPNPSHPNNGIDVKNVFCSPLMAGASYSADVTRMRSSSHLSPTTLRVVLGKIIILLQLHQGKSRIIVLYLLEFIF